MSDITWLGVLGVAFGAQLAVLPGEKVQFIIAGLSTRYSPMLVVSAAGTAFAGWTALEVALGSAVTRALPAVYLDTFAAGMFVLFAVMLYRSAPAPGETVHEVPAVDGQPDGPAGDDPASAGRADGGESLSVTIPGTDRTVPTLVNGFLPVFAMMAFGEFGDKTQLITITLASQYPAHPEAIWAGEMLAIIPVSLLNALFFHRFAHRFDRRRAHLAGAALFAFFAADFAAKVLLGVSVWETVVGALASLARGPIA
ncbi:MAG: TMEM165/GDT1 family protein [Halobacteriaceae archaeon]